MESGETVRRRWLSLQTPRQLRRRCNSIWGLSRSRKRPCKTETLSIMESTKAAKTPGGPQIGDPKKTVPLESERITRRTDEGNSEKP